MFPRMELSEDGSSDLATSSDAGPPAGMDDAASVEDFYDTLDDPSLAEDFKTQHNSSMRLHMFTFLPPELSADPGAAKSNLLTVRIAGGAWAEPFEIDLGVKSRRLPVELSGSAGPALLRPSRYTVACSVRPAPGVFHRTKIVTVAPQFYFTNHTSQAPSTRPRCHSAPSFPVAIVILHSNTSGARKNDSAALVCTARRSSYGRSVGPAWLSTSS
jgi:hypothetical protein